MAEFDPVAAGNSPDLGEQELRNAAARARMVALPSPVVSGPPGVSAPTVNNQPSSPLTSGMPAVSASPMAPMKAPAAVTPEDQRLQQAQARLTQAEKPAGVVGLMQKAKDIGTDPDSFLGRHHLLGKIARIGGEIGAGALRGVSTAGDILTPGVTAAIPGTNMNRVVNVLGARANLDDAEKSKLQAAQAEEAKAKAEGATGQQKLTADMAAKGYSPITDQMGRTSWQFTGKGEEKVVTDDRQTLPDGSKNPNFGKSVYATLDPQGKPLSYGALAAEPNKAAPAPTAESVHLDTEALEKQLTAGTLDQTPGARETLAQRQREQKLQGLDSATQAVVAGTYGGPPPVPADYPKGAKDAAYIAAEKKWGQIAQDAKIDPTVRKNAEQAVKQYTMKVNEDLTKAGHEYRKATEGAHQLLSLISAAEQGNKVASVQIQPDGAMVISTANGVKRVSPVEFESMQGAGSAWDQIKKYAGHQFTGDALPQELLDNFKQLAQIVQQNGYQSYLAHYNDVKSQYEPQGVKFDKIPPIGAPHRFQTQDGVVTIEDYELKDFKKWYPKAVEIK